MSANLVALFREVPPLAELPPEVQASLAGEATTREMTRGQFLLRAGEPADAFFGVLSGQVFLEMPGATGPITFATLEPGELIGWSWLVPPYRWRATALILCPTRLLAFRAAPIRQHCQDDPAFGYHLHRCINEVLARRMSAARKKLARFYG